MSQPEIKISFESQRAVEAFRAFMRTFGKSVPETLREQGREIARRTMLFTPPQKGPAQGKAAVKRDIIRAVNPVDAKTLRNPKLNKIARERNYAAMDVIMQRVAASGGFGGRFVPFTPELHQTVRDSRGRVMRDRGLNTFDADEVRAYIVRKQANVGRAKGGWAAALRGLGGTPPGYAARHASLGSFLDRASNPVNAYIQMTNRSEWAKGGNGGDAGRVVANALRSQVNAIYKAIADKAAKAKRESGL